MPDEVIEQTDNELLNDEEEVLDDKKIELEEDEVEETEEEENLEAKEDEKFPFETPSFSEIKAEFPEFFKKFPQFRDVVFQQAEYRKMFPTVDDAKEAVDDSITFHGLRDGILAGKAEMLIDAIDETDKAASERFALSFLPALHKKNSELYSATITPLFENLTRTLFRSSDENTRNAALVVAQFLFGKDGEAIVEGAKTFSRNLEKSEDQKKIDKEREDFNTQKYQDFRGGVVQEMTSGLSKLVSRGLDPDSTMSDYAKKTLIADIVSRVDKALAADDSHISNMNARWLRANKEGFNLTSKEKLVAAYLSRAKQVIPSIRDKARNDFLGTRKETSERKNREIESKSSRKEIVGGRTSSGNGSKEVLKPSKELFRKMSDMDILAS